MSTPVVPLGSRVVNEVLQIVSDVSSHVVYFYNFFTSYQLMKDLADRGIRACGTVRDYRTYKFPLKINSVKILLCIHMFLLLDTNIQLTENIG